MKLFRTRATDPKQMLARMSQKRHARPISITSIGGLPIIDEDKPITYIRDGYMGNPDVYAVVNIITRAAAAVPPVVMEVKDEKRARQYYRLKYSQRNGVHEGFKERQAELREKAFEEVDENDDLYKLINRPNPLQAWPEFFENTMGFLEITGNSYTHGIELTDGRIGEMWPLPPHLTQIKATNSVEAEVQAYILNYAGQHSLDPESVLHLNYWNPDYSGAGSHLYGMSPLRAARAAVASSNDGLSALTSSYRNMGAAGIAFPDDPDVETLTAEQQAALARELQSAAGPKNAKSILVTSTKMGWQSFGLSPVDLEILSTLNLSLRKICNIYGISSELLNDPENKTQANKKEARRSLYMENVIPKMENIFAELNRWLVPRFPGKKYHIDYDVSAIEALSEDMERKVNWLRNAWWLTIDERRAAMNYDESENPLANELWVPAGMMPIGELPFEDELELRELASNYGVKDE